MLEGKNMNIATNEAVTSYGEVSGMTFFGMYQLDRNDRVLTAFYDKNMKREIPLLLENSMHLLLVVMC